MKQVAYCTFQTELGVCGMAWTEAAGGAAPAVVAFQLPEATAGATQQRIARHPGARRSSTPPPAIAGIIRKVQKHLAGEAQDLRDIRVDLGGVGAFARKVYEAARKIPAGQTRTYGQLAKAIGHPLAARAVGQALGKNPVALIVPCHRVQAAAGKPGGFSAHGGRTTKARMLALEGVALEDGAAGQTGRPLPRVSSPKGRSSRATAKNRPVMATGLPSVP